MDRLAADHRRQRAFGRPDDHPLADELLGIPAADRLSVEKAVVVKVADQHANLVAVPGEHHPHLGRRVLRGNDVAVQVGRHAVGEIAGIGANHVLDRLLIAGGTGRFEQAEEKVAGGGVHKGTEVGVRSQNVQASIAGRG